MDQVDAVEQRKNKTKSSIRAKVEHAIGVIKRICCIQTQVVFKKKLHRLASLPL